MNAVHGVYVDVLVEGGACVYVHIGMVQTTSLGLLESCDIQHVNVEMLTKQLLTDLVEPFYI